MRHWDLQSIDVLPRHPIVLDSRRGESRSIALHLSAGDALDEHQVHERAHLVVVDGQVEVRNGAAPQRGGPGLLAIFDPAERHEIRAVTDARLLLILAPWPGDGHPGARDE